MEMEMVPTSENGNGNLNGITKRYRDEPEGYIAGKNDDGIFHDDDDVNEDDDDPEYGIVSSNSVFSMNNGGKHPPRPLRTGGQQQKRQRVVLPRWLLLLGAVALLVSSTSIVTLRVAKTSFLSSSKDGGGQRSRKWIPTLLTDIEPLQSYKGKHKKVRGRVTVRFEDNESEMLVRYELEGLEPNCLGCGIHIHEGTSCTGDLKGLFTNHSLWGEGGGGGSAANPNDSSDEDPWKTYGRYNSNKDGVASNAFVIPTIFGGKGSNKATENHVVVVHSRQGDPLGCGELTRMFNINLMEAEMGRYPVSSSGSSSSSSQNRINKINPTGTIRVLFFEDNVFRIFGSIDGLEPNCMNCGIHIHTGTTCSVDEMIKLKNDENSGDGSGRKSRNLSSNSIIDDGNNSTSATTNSSSTVDDDEEVVSDDIDGMIQEMVGGHWYDMATIGSDNDDPWLAQRATYATDDKGHTDFAFYIYNGYDYESNVDHVFVMHDSDGRRIACGELKPHEIS